MDARFFDGMRGPVFHVLHSPQTDKPRGSVLFVPPFGEELNKSRRMVAEQSRWLAAAGYTVLRPDLYGCGDSAGELEDAHWDDWLYDLGQAARRLREDHPGPLHLWGLRTGCLLAGMLAHCLQTPPAALLYWQPVANGQVFLNQFLRLRVAAGLIDGQGESTKALRARLQAGESLDIAGQRLPPQIADALQNARLPAPPAGSTVHWFEVSQGKTPALAPASERWLDARREEGAEVTSHAVRGEAFWGTQDIRTVPALWRETVAALTGQEAGPETGSQQPLVSVVMPAYNAGAYIQQAIDSVLAQDYPAVELIVVDDGSSDDTVARVQAYGDRVKLLTQANQGSAVARNRGLEAARGEYIAFLDSDDVWLPGKLTAQVAYLERHPDVDLVYSRWQTWRPEADGHFAPPERVLGETDTGASATDAGGEIPLVPERSGWLYGQLLFGSFLHTITVMARRRLIEAVGSFDPDLKRGQDYDYWLRASRHTEIHKLDRIHALYRLHGAGCITRWPEVNYEHRVLQKALERWGVEGPDGSRADWRAIQRRLAATCFDFGYHHYWQGEPRRAAAAFRQALGHHPLHLGSLRYLGMSLVRSIRHPA